MIKIVTVTILILLFVYGGIFLHGAPAIQVSISPSFIPVNTPTEITIEASIVDSAVISSSVFLLRANELGTAFNQVAVMKDDGSSGDAKANDRVFTSRLTLNEATPGVIRFQVSAAFRGVLQRIRSDVVLIVESATAVDVGTRLRVDLAALLNPVSVFLPNTVPMPTGSERVFLSWRPETSTLTLISRSKLNVPPPRPAATLNFRRDSVFVVTVNNDNTLANWQILSDPSLFLHHELAPDGTNLPVPTNVPEAKFFVDISDDVQIKSIRIYSVSQTQGKYILSPAGQLTLR